MAEVQGPPPQVNQPQNLKLEAPDYAAVTAAKEEDPVIELGDRIRLSGGKYDGTTGRVIYRTFDKLHLTTRRLLISPRHRVAVGGQMVEARNLGLKQEEATGTLTYYNLGLGGANMIVAGVTVESLAPMVRVTISRAEFNYILATKYGGRMTPEIRAACHFLADGVSVPVAP
jgi:hypothetical protein